MNNPNLTILENPCHNCYESYCHKNCDKYTEWEKNVEAVKNAIEERGLTKFFLPLYILKEFKSDILGTAKERTTYRCPTCKQILSKQLCETKSRLRHCYYCGQLLNVEEDM